VCVDHKPTSDPDVNKGRPIVRKPALLRLRQEAGWASVARTRYSWFCAGMLTQFFIRVMTPGAVHAANVTLRTGQGKGDVVACDEPFIHPGHEQTAGLVVDGPQGHHDVPCACRDRGADEPDNISTGGRRPASGVTRGQHHEIGCEIEPHNVADR